MDEENLHLQLLFSTPLWKSKIENFQEVNKTMYGYIKKLHSEGNNGPDKSAIGGWHSPNFDLNHKEPRQFVNSINKSLNRAFIDMGWDLKSQTVKITGMWSVINNTGASNARHIHPNNFLSAAYYVKAPSNCGDIIFYDPRTGPVYRKPKIANDNKLNASEVSIQPEEGLLILFPSYLHHSVKANMSDSERIVISFNIDLN